MKRKIKIPAMITAILLAAVTVLSVAVSAGDKEFPVTGNGKSAPPMGFNTWYIYLDGFKEDTIKDVVTAMEKKGLRDLGYQYIQIDWGWCAGDRDWYTPRNEDGSLNPDPWKFSSVKALANYLHRRGYRIGYYTDTGYKGVGNGIGSAGHYKEDINQFVGWDMDFIKIDSGGGHPLHDTLAQAYAEIFDDILASESEKQIPVCICGLDVNSVPGLYEKYVGEGKLPFIYYRVAADISSSIPTVNWDDPTYSVLTTFDAAMAHPEMSRPGCYFDMDTLMLENNGLTAEENKSYFTMFCIAPSTLFLAVDIPNIKDETLELISNEEAIAINQDPLCNAARLVREDSKGEQVYSKVQSDEKGHKVRAVMLFNRTGEAKTISVNWSDIGLSGNCTIRDIWQRSDVAPSAEGYSAEVPSHGVVFLKVTEEAVDPNYVEPVTENEDTTASETTEKAPVKKNSVNMTAVIGAAVAGIAIIGAVLGICLKKKK